MIPKNFNYLDSFVIPRVLQPSKRSLTEHITQSNRFKYFLELKNMRDTVDHITFKPEDFPHMRVVYILVWISPEGEVKILKVGCSQKCYQRIGRNYLQGSGANTGWLSPALYAFLKEKKGEIEIYVRPFDQAREETDDDIPVQFVPRLDTIEKHYQKELGIQDGKEAVNKFFEETNFSYVIK